MALNTGARTFEWAAETTVSFFLTRARTSSEVGPVPCVIFPPSARLMEPMPGTTLEMSFQIFSTLSKTLETIQFHGAGRLFFSAAQVEDWLPTPWANRLVMVLHQVAAAAAMAAHAVMAVDFIVFHPVLSADSILLMAELIEE